MRTIRRDPPVRSDPAPSRAAYRVTRLWLSPFFRFCVKVVLPVLVLLGVAGTWALNSVHRDGVLHWAQDLRGSIAERPEFVMRQMIISGAVPELSREIREKMPVKFPVSWFDLDTDELRAVVLSFDAVEDASVTLDLNGAVRVRVEQRVPVVLWRNHGGLELLDITGHRVALIDRRDGRADLPLITGDGADHAVAEALAILVAAEPVAHRLRGLTRQGARRWDVVLDQDQRIQLPEEKPVAALERMLALQDARDILGRDVALIDLRRPGRETVRLREDALAYLNTMRAFEQGLSTQ
ncbi:MAG: cell division protein FtsQ/DivIB [Mangrovicoccus sp.]|nr:cell division protein FtsQ/DivIB [Mangrovicoccus sp.]